MERVLKKSGLVTRCEASALGVQRERAWDEAAAIATEDIAANAAIVFLRS